MGEPTLNPWFFDMVLSASKRGMRVGTNSNLASLRKDDAQRWVTCGLNDLQVSVAGVSSRTHESICRGSSLDRVLRNLEEILEQRFLLNIEHLKIRLVFVAMRQNFDELPQLVRLAANLGVDGIFVQNLCHDYGDVKTSERYSKVREFSREQSLLFAPLSKVTSTFAEAEAEADSYHVELRLPRLRPRGSFTSDTQPCDWPWTGVYITYDGFVMPCCMISTPDRLNFGNILESSFESIWNSERFSAFRERLRTEDPPEVCGACSVYKGIF
jgi:radical SAM protein with 4Fe4S-binding SPASM domain